MQFPWKVNKPGGGGGGGKVEANIGGMILPPPMAKVCVCVCVCGGGGGGGISPPGSATYALV